MATRAGRNDPRMSSGISSSASTRNRNRSQYATVRDSVYRNSGRTGSLAIAASEIARPSPSPRREADHGHRRELAAAGLVGPHLGARDDGTRVIGDEESPPLEVARVQPRRVDQVVDRAGVRLGRRPDDRPGDRRTGFHAAHEADASIHDRRSLRPAPA